MKSKTYTIKQLKNILSKIPMGTHMEPYYSRYMETGKMFSPKESVIWFLDNLKTYEN